MSRDWMFTNTNLSRDGLATSERAAAAPPITDHLTSVTEREIDLLDQRRGLRILCENVS